MATETQTKLVGFCLGNKTNYNATAYANHIWFDPTNKQILLNGIEYIPKKLSELVNDKNFLTSITKAMVEGVLTGNITSHTHSYIPLADKGLSNGKVSYYVNFPSYTQLVSLGYNEESTKTEDEYYFKGLCKWAIDNYANQGGILLIGNANPNGVGYCCIQLYSDSGKDANTGLPQYCSGTYCSLITRTINFYCYDYIWTWKGTFVGNAETASKWANARTITLTGSVTGSVSIDGSANVSLVTTTNHTHNEYLPLTGGTLTGALTCNGYHIDMNNDSGSRGYRGFFNQSNNTNRASGSHIFMKGGGQALGTNSVSIGYQAYAGIRNEDADKTTYPYIAWQWMPTEKFMVDTTNSATLSGGEYYGFPLLPNEMVRWSIGGQNVIYENSSSYKELLVVIKASDADTGLVFGGKTTLPYRASKTLIAGKYIVGVDEYLKNITEITINDVKYYQVIIYTSNTTAFPTYYDFTQQVKVMCATKVNNSNYNGASSYASGAYSVASGAYSVASGYFSVASGAYSVASHSYCAVLARNGETMSSYQTIVGKFNAKVAGLFIIGNGTSDTARSNAFVVDDSGNVKAKYFSGYANAIGGEGIKVYASNANEINFGGTSSTTAIYFGYRSLDSRPTPTVYNFGNGTATIQAASFSGNAATATKSEYSRNLLGRNTSGSDYPAISGNLVFAEWNTMSDNRWYLKANGYECRVAYATSATKLGVSSVGSATQPIYLNGGTPTACSYTLAKSVPSNAVFTDTTYSVATASTNGLMSAAMFNTEKVSSISVHQGAVQFEEPVRNHDIYVTYNKDKALNSDAHIVGGDVRIKIPNATKDYDGSMSYTDKRKLDGISPYAPKKVVALRLSYTHGSVTVIRGGGDYDMTQDAELMQSASSDGVEENYNGIHYYTTFTLDLAAASTDTLNQLFNNNFVKFSFMGKDTSYVPDTVDVKSSFDGDVLYVVFSSLDSQETWVVDCVWEFF